MADARFPAARKQPYSLAGQEAFVTFLHDRYELPIIQSDRDFKRYLSRRTLFDSRAGQATDDRAQDRADDLSLAATDVAAGDPANCRSGHRSCAGLRSLEADLANALDHSLANRHFLPSLLARVDAARLATGARRQQGAQQCDEHTVD
jgi:hypothetical protein